MNADQIELAARLVACKRFRWMRGMAWLMWFNERDTDNLAGLWDREDWAYSGRVEFQDDADRWNATERRASGIRDNAEHHGTLPDIANPGMLGFLLALVREAWGDPRGCVIPMADGRWGWKSASTVDALTRRPVAIRGDSEAEALIAALEAAP